MGSAEKKVSFEGKILNFSEINFEKSSFNEDFKKFIDAYLDQNEEVVMQTSGSTGKPKRITIPKKHMRASARATLDFLDIREGAKALLCMSPRYIGGAMMVVRWLEHNLDLYAMEPSANPLENVETSIDLAAMVPYQVQASLQDLPRVKKLLIGGAPVDNVLEKKLEDMPGEIYQTFGMTETISHIALRRINGPERSSYYKALPGVYFSTDEDDRLTIRASQIGVENLKTNDVVHLQNEHSFEWLSRVDNVVNSAGVKLYPELIETKIGELGFSYFLAGIPDEKFGQKLVLIAEGASQNLEDLQSHLSKLSKYEKPKEILVVDRFVKTENGKLNRRETVKIAVGFSGNSLPGSLF